MSAFATGATLFDVIPKNASWSLGLAVCLCALSFPRPAWACGALVFAEEDNGSMSDQQVLIAHGADRTALVVSVGYSGAARDFAFLLPLQREPLAVHDSEPGLFVRLDEISRPRVRIVDDSQHYGSAGCGCLGGAAKMPGAAAPGNEEVEVVQRGETATYQYVVVGGKSGTSVQSWLEKESFVIPASAASGIDRYLSRGWLFLAARLKPKADFGNLAPIELDYPHMQLEEIEYPFALSATSVPAGRQVTVDLYLLSGKPILPQNYRTTRVDHEAIKAVSRSTTNYRELSEQAMRGGAFLIEIGLPDVYADFVFRYWTDLPRGSQSETTPLLESYRSFLPENLSFVRLRARLAAAELRDLKLRAATPSEVQEINVIVVHLDKPLPASALVLLFGVAWARRRLRPRPQLQVPVGSTS